MHVYIWYVMVPLTQTDNGRQTDRHKHFNKVKDKQIDIWHVRQTITQVSISINESERHDIHV